MVVPVPLGEGGSPLPIRYGQLLAIGVIVLLALINYFGVRVGGDVQVATTLLKVGLIGAIIVIGLGSGLGSVANYHSSTPAAGGILGFFAALVGALWAYDGWNNVTMVASEVRKPQRNLPLALIVGTLAVIAIYLLTNLAYFYVLPAATVASTDRVAAEMMRRILGAPGAAAVSLAAMISIFAALNGSILSGSRVPFAMARDGLFFHGVERIHPVHRTPSVSILVLSAWACLLVLSGRYDQLYTYVIFASAILYGMATASVIVLRFRRPDMPRPYRTIGYPVVPIAFVLGISLPNRVHAPQFPPRIHPGPAADFPRPAVLFLLEKAPVRLDSPSFALQTRPDSTRSVCYEAVLFGLPNKKLEKRGRMRYKVYYGFNEMACSCSLFRTRML